MLNVRGWVKRWSLPGAKHGHLPADTPRTRAQTQDDMSPASAERNPNLRRSGSFPIIYSIAIFGSMAALIGLFGVSLAGLNYLGLLPPPQISNNFCLDSKLQYLREHRFESPIVLAVGSSVTWRSFDGNAVTQASHGRDNTFNGAFCGLHMNQTVFVAHYFLAHYPTVRVVVTIVAPQDMTKCSKVRTQVFSRSDVDDYVYHRTWTFPLYLKYFDPSALFRNVAMMSAIRDGKLPFDLLANDRYGTAPLKTNLTKSTLAYGALPPLDPTCFAALHNLAEILASEGRRLVVVTMPVNPEWTAHYDPRGKLMRVLATNIKAALAHTPAVFWDAEHEFSLKQHAFIDAIHIRWAAAKIFSRALVKAVAIVRLAGPPPERTAGR